MWQSWGGGGLDHHRLCLIQNAPRALWERRAQRQICRKPAAPHRCTHIKPLQGPCHKGGICYKYSENKTMNAPGRCSAQGLQIRADAEVRIAVLFLVALMFKRMNQELTQREVWGKEPLGQVKIKAKCGHFFVLKIQIVTMWTASIFPQCLFYTSKGKRRSKGTPNICVMFPTKKVCTSVIYPLGFADFKHPGIAMVI